ncbi:MAG: hypothetical protein IPG71_04350 [bacterium]|nr:hypothetical protein [bacterium]
MRRNVRYWAGAQITAGLRLSLNPTQGHKVMQNYFIDTWALYLEMAPYLLLGFSLAGVLHAFVPRKAVGRHLGGENLISAFKAAVLGCRCRSVRAE